MINLLKWIFFPGFVSRFGGDGAGGDSGSNYEAEEARKSQLRKQIDLMYGIGGPSAAPTREQFTTGGTPASESSGGEAGTQTYTEATPGIFDETGFNAALEMSKGDAGAKARAAMDSENTRVGDATRSYYTDRLGKDYAKAERETRFKLARQGLMGGSEDVFQQNEIKSDRDLGATRVDEAVRRAVADLKGKREQERLNAVSLVNAGAGDSAVSAAQAGLKNTFETATSAQRVNLFDDLFANTAESLANGAQTDQQAALLARYRNQLSSFIPARSSTSGKLTGTQ